MLKGEKKQHEELFSRMKELEGKQNDGFLSKVEDLEMSMEKAARMRELAGSHIASPAARIAMMRGINIETIAVVVFAVIILAILLMVGA